MKVGGLKPVTIDGIMVGEAKVTKVDGEVVSMEFPGQRVDFKVRMILTDEGPEKHENPNQTIVTAEAPESIVGAPTKATAEPGTASVEPGQPVPEVIESNSTPNAPVVEVKEVAPIAEPPAESTPTE